MKDKIEYGHPDHGMYQEGKTQGFALAEKSPYAAQAIAGLDRSDPWLAGFKDGFHEWKIETAQKFRDQHFADYGPPDLYNIKEFKDQVLTEKARQDPHYLQYIRGYEAGFSMADKAPDEARAINRTKSFDPWNWGFSDGRQDFAMTLYLIEASMWRKPEHTPNASLAIADGQTPALIHNERKDFDRGER